MVSAGGNVPSDWEIVLDDQGEPGKVTTHVRCRDVCEQKPHIGGALPSLQLFWLLSFLGFSGGFHLAR